MLVNRLPVAVMAAGSSCRFGSDKRFFCLPTGTTILQTTLSNIISAHSDNSIHLVVSHSDNAPVFIALLPSSSSLIVSKHSHEGLGGSLKDLMCWLAESSCAQADAIGVYLADMPRITSNTMQMLQKKAAVNKIVRPVYNGVLGHPVWIGREFWSSFRGLTGDNGGREVLKAFILQTEFVEVEDAGVIMDVDTPEAAVGLYGLNSRE